MTQDEAINFDQRVNELEAIRDQRFDTSGKRFAASHAAVCSMMSALKPYLVENIRKAIEQFSGLSPLKAEPFVMVVDEEEGDWSGAKIEFDALVSNGRTFLVQVKWYAELEDVILFDQEAAFAERKLGPPVEKVLLTLGIEAHAADAAERLGIIWYAATIR